MNEFFPRVQKQQGKAQEIAKTTMWLKNVRHMSWHLKVNEKYFKLALKSWVLNLRKLILHKFLILIVKFDYVTQSQIRVSDR